MAQRYDTYKDSGVQWLGEIPGHWGAVPLKRICEMKSGNNLTSFDILEAGPYPVYGANGFRGYYTQYNKEGKFILIGRQGALAGNVHLVDGRFWATDHAVVTNITSNKVYVEYISLALESMNLNQYAFDTAAQPGLAVSRIISFSVPLPPLSEQKSIVSYLDDKCGKIEKLLAGKQKQIELLAEMKQRIIADAVTRGLNPDVKMKVTNIPWLPEIPEHWEEKRLSSMFTGEVEINKDFEFKRAFKFNYGQLVPKNEIGDSEEYREVYVKYSKIKTGDILINGLNLNYDFITQRVACAPSDGIITSAYVVCRPRDGVNHRYFTYLFNGMDSMKLFHGMGSGIRLTLSFKEMKKQIIPLPPLTEQRAIVSYLDDKTSKIDTLVAKLQQEIEAIKEYKQRLISDVVTGQIKVC